MKKLSFFLMAMLFTCATTLQAAEVTETIAMKGFGGLTTSSYENVTKTGTSDLGTEMVAYAFNPSTGQVRGNKTAIAGASVTSADANKNWSLYNTQAMPGAIKSIKVTQTATGTNKFQNKLYVALGTTNQGAVTTVTGAKENTTGTATEFTFDNIDETQGYTYFKLLSNVKFTSNSVAGVVVTVTYVTGEEDPDATKYTVTTKVNDETMGTVTGAGEYVEGKTATLTANPNTGYKFVNWSNGETANPLKLTVTENVEITANFAVIPPMTCAEAAATASGETVVLNPFDVVYVVKDAGYIYIKDESGVNLIYDFNLDDKLKAGDHVEGFVGTSSPYNGLPELKSSVSYSDLTVTSGTAPEPTLKDAAPTTAELNQYVKFENVTLSADATFTTASATNATMVVNGTDVVLRNNFKLAATLSKDKAYNIVGFVGCYNSTMQVYYLSAEEYVAPVVNHTITVTATAEGEDIVTGAGEYEEGEEVTVTASEDLEGWVFIGWTEDGEFVANDPEYTFVVKGDVELVAVYAMDLGENEVTDLVIDGDNMLLTGSVAGFPMGTMNLELALGEYDDEEGVYLLTEESKLYVGETNFTFVDGMAAVDMSTNSAMAIVVFELEEAYYYMMVDMSAAPAEPVDLVVTDATIYEEDEILFLTAPWEGKTIKAELPATEHQGWMMIEIHEGEDFSIAMSQNATIATVDNVLTINGVFTDNNSHAVYNVTISGTLPVVEPTTITYELNGGAFPEVKVPTNAELWEAFKPYYNTYYGLTRADQPIDKVSTFASAYMQKIMTDEASEYKWLGDYVLGVAASQGVTLPTDMAAANEGAWRWAVHAFFNAGVGANGAAGTDFTEAGKPEVWGAAYEAEYGVVLPTEPVTEDYVLPTPVKEGYTFVGWYDNAEGTGEAYTVIPAGWAGTLYAIWKQSPATALDNIAIEGKVVKTIINGQLIIIKNGVQYNALGQVIK